MKILSKQRPFHKTEKELGNPKADFSKVKKLVKPGATLLEGKIKNKQKPIPKSEKK